MVPPIPRSPRGREVCNISQSCFCTVLCIEGKDASGTESPTPSIAGGREVRQLKYTGIKRDLRETGGSHGDKGEGVGQDG